MQCQLNKHMDNITFEYLTERFKSLVSEAGGRRSSYLELDPELSLPESLNKIVSELESKIVYIDQSMQKTAEESRGSKLKGASVSLYKAVLLRSMILDIEESLENGEKFTLDSVNPVNSPSNGTKRQNKTRNAVNSNMSKIESIIKNYGVDKQYVNDVDFNTGEKESSTKVSSKSRSHFITYIKVLIDKAASGGEDADKYAAKLSEISAVLDGIKSSSFSNDESSNIWDDSNKSIKALLRNVVEWSPPPEKNKQSAFVDKSNIQKDIKELRASVSKGGKKNLFQQLNTELAKINKIKKASVDVNSKIKPETREKYEKYDINSINKYFGYGGEEFDTSSTNNNSVKTIFSEDGVFGDEYMIPFLNADKGGTISDEGIEASFENFAEEEASDPASPIGLFLATLKTKHGDDYTSEDVTSLLSKFQQQVSEMGRQYINDGKTSLDDFDSDIKPDLEKKLVGITNAIIQNFINDDMSKPAGVDALTKLTIAASILEYRKQISDNEFMDDDLGDAEYELIMRGLASYKPIIDEIGLDEVAYKFKLDKEYHQTLNDIKQLRTGETQEINDTYRLQTINKFIEVLERNSYVERDGNGELDFQFNDDLESLYKKFVEDINKSKYRAEMDRIFKDYLSKSIDESSNETYSTKYLTVEDLEDNLNQTRKWFSNDALDVLIPQLSELDSHLKKKNTYSDNSNAGEITKDLFEQSGDSDALEALESQGMLKSNTIFSPTGESFSIFSDTGETMQGYEQRTILNSANISEADISKFLVDENTGIINRLDLSSSNQDNLLLFPEFSSVAGQMSQDVIHDTQIVDAMSYLRNTFKKIKGYYKKAIAVSEMIDKMNADSSVSFTEEDLSKIDAEYTSINNVGRGQSISGDRDSDKIMKSASNSMVKESDEIFDNYMGEFSQRVGRKKTKLISENYNKKKYKNYNHWLNDVT